jgi:hypothetical protein
MFKMFVVSPGIFYEQPSHYREKHRGITPLPEDAFEYRTDWIIDLRAKFT